MADESGTAGIDAKATTTDTHHTHGEHIDTIEKVDAIFKRQRRLSFSYGAVFFIVTLFIPAASVWWAWWYDTEIWGGFTMNYMFVAILYFVFLWVMAWTYAKQADKLDHELGVEDTGKEG